MPEPCLENDFDPGLDGVMWVRKHSDREVFKVFMKHIAEDFATIRARFKLSKIEINVYLTFQDAERTQAMIYYRGLHKGRYGTLVQHPLRFTVVDGRVTAVVWS